MRFFRSQKVAGALHKEISGILQTEIKDPGIGFATVTGVEMSKDIRYAKVFVSILGDKVRKQESLKALERARTYIQNMLGERLQLRFVPILHFYLDESYEYGSRIDSLLQKLHSGPPVGPNQDKNETK
jgi:ribosome-binding factor A